MKIKQALERKEKKELKDVRNESMREVQSNETQPHFTSSTRKISEIKRKKTERCKCSFITVIVFLEW